MSPGMYKFEQIGRYKKSFEAEIGSDADVFRAVQPHLRSRDLEFEYDIERGVGEVFAGGRSVGTFRMVHRGHAAS